MSLRFSSNWLSCIWVSSASFSLARSSARLAFMTSSFSLRSFTSARRFSNSTRTSADSAPEAAGAALSVLACCCGCTGAVTGGAGLGAGATEGRPLRSVGRGSPLGCCCCDVAAGAGMELGVAAAGGGAFRDASGAGIEPALGATRAVGGVAAWGAAYEYTKGIFLSRSKQPQKDIERQPKSVSRITASFKFLERLGLRAFYRK